MIQGMNLVCIILIFLRIITGHVDNIVRFWDAKTGDRVKELSGIHAGQITSVSVSPG